LVTASPALPELTFAASAPAASETESMKSLVA
jgi:hypothetical protein